jgi:hypothetical protein
MSEANASKKISDGKPSDEDGHFFCRHPDAFKTKRIKMTQGQVALHWTARRTKADQIIANATNFKACDQCWAIMRKHAGMCAVCGAYRFREEVASVRTIAEMTKHSPFPVTAGTVPRF